jgi:hypothetical protein
MRSARGRAKLRLERDKRNHRVHATRGAGRFAREGPRVRRLAAGGNRIRTISTASYDQGLERKLRLGRSPQRPVDIAGLVASDHIAAVEEDVLECGRRAAFGSAEGGG